MTRIHTLIFDLDETLMYEASTERDAFTELCGWLLRPDAPESRHVEGIEFEAAEKLRGRLYEIATEVWLAGPAAEFVRDVGVSPREGLWGEFSGSCEGFGILEAWIPGYRKTVWSRLMDENGGTFVRDVSEIIDKCIETRSRYHIPFDETEAVLTGLSTSFRLAILTNGAPRVQRAKLAGAGLESWFDPVVVSGDLCAGKPDPATFLRVAEMIGQPTPGFCMIGDSYAKDILGALDCGMCAVFLDRDNITPAHSIDANVPRITRLAELPAAIENP